MNVRPTRITLLLAVFGPASIAACSDGQPSPADLQGGSSASGSDGSATGGAASSSGGSQPTGGAPTGGSAGTSAGTGAGGAGLGGGAGVDSGGAGGTPAMGGQSGGAAEGGAPQGGAPLGGMAGLGGSGGRGGSGGSGGSAGTGGSSGGCARGQTEPSEVILIGDSFIALNHSITNQIEVRARAAGALGQSEDYRDVAVSGATLTGNNQIPSQYTNAANASPVKVVLMDGGGNDCIRGDSAGPLTAATSLFQTMSQGTVEHVVYFFYPDPVGSNWASLKSCLDTLRPQMKSLCDGLTKPQCHFMDLRTVWQPSYAQSDGIHPTVEGGTVVGNAVWDAMQAECIAQ